MVQVASVNIEKLKRILFAHPVQNPRHISHPLNIAVKVLVVGAEEFEALHLGVVLNHSLHVLEAISLQLVLPELDFDIFLISVKTFWIEKVHGQSEEESAVAAQDCAKDAKVDKNVCIFEAAISTEEIEYLYDELWEIFNREFQWRHKELGFEDFVMNIVDTQSLTSELRKRECSENYLPPVVIIILNGVLVSIISRAHQQKVSVLWIIAANDPQNKHKWVQFWQQGQSKRGQTHHEVDAQVRWLWNDGEECEICVNVENVELSEEHFQGGFSVDHDFV